MWQIQKSITLEGDLIYKFDFTNKEYEEMISNCNFTEDELLILDLRRNPKQFSVIEISFRAGMSTAKVSRLIYKISRKIARHLVQ